MPGVSALRVRRVDAGDAVAVAAGQELVALDQAPEQVRVAVEVDAQALHRRDLEPRRRRPTCAEPSTSASLVAALPSSVGCDERAVASAALPIRPAARSSLRESAQGTRSVPPPSIETMHPAADHGRLVGQPVRHQRQRHGHGRARRDRERRTARR